MPYAAADVLKGGVLQEDQYKNSTPGLNRNDIQGDPFREGASSNNGPVDQMLELPPGGMDIGGLRAPAPQKKPMSGNAQDSGGDFNGQKMMPVQEDPPYTPPPSSGRRIYRVEPKVDEAMTLMVAQLRCSCSGMPGTNG
jgi:hypothetical protein